MEIVKIRPKHFKSATEYQDNSNCPLAIALKEHFRTNDVRVYLDFAMINDVAYKFNERWSSMNKNAATMQDELIQRARQKKRVGTFTLKISKK